MIQRSRKLAAILSTAALMAGLAACEKKDTAAEGKGAAEKAGAQIDQATTKAGEKLNELAGKAGEQMQKAGEKMQEKAAEAKKGDSSAPSSSDQQKDGSAKQ